jgi:hypothetical protein
MYSMSWPLVHVLESTAVLIYLIAVICDRVRSIGGQTPPEGQCEGLLEGAIYISLIGKIAAHSLLLHHTWQSSGRA